MNWYTSIIFAEFHGCQFIKKLSIFIHSFLSTTRFRKALKNFLKNEAIEFNNSKIIQAVGHLCVKKEHTLSPWNGKKKKCSTREIVQGRNFVVFHKKFSNSSLLLRVFVLLFNEAFPDNFFGSIYPTTIKSASK